MQHVLALSVMNGAAGWMLRRRADAGPARTRHDGKNTVQDEERKLEQKTKMLRSE